MLKKTLTLMLAFLIVFANRAVAAMVGEQQLQDVFAVTAQTCGIGLDRFNDIKEGDMFEVYTIEEYRD